MTCARCQQFAAAPGGTLCAQCAVPAPPLAAAPGAALRSPVGLGRAAATLLGLVVAADLFAVVADVLEMNVTGDIADGVTGAGVIHRADRADLLYNASGVAQAIALLATMAVYLCWLWRVRGNAEVFNPGGHSKARGWTIAGWFVPVVNLWFPRRVTLDIWDSSAPWAERPSHALVNCWWGVWIVSLFADRAADTEYRHADAAAELHDAARQMLFSDVIDIAAALLAVLVVLKITRMQHQRALAGAVPAPAFG
ncbi:hypothetical protein AQI88_22590 [Streptomyces cellostaticus]|uniref:DUF4328 domain-containing protein n=1 Tax=Streptomyces cellostaticus TaxID=67285 RepID=A0A101NJF6_9ACTN|nr:DUF4328 domain-containing protein [Streptomyces cellostaticus]KUM94167.1 hypothetical protein AQI88_22590 [Streptomyces cellostaticus]GHI05450.1 hypothetical protein Scel_37710 [Streptomyces cellostaticus]